MKRHGIIVALFLFSCGFLLLAGCSSTDPMAFSQQEYAQTLGKNRAKFYRGTPKVDSTCVKEAIWDRCDVYKTQVVAQNDYSDSTKPAEAEFQCMWDDSFYYCYASIRDSAVDCENPNTLAYQNDGVEFYIDENDSAILSYDKDDCQLRITVNDSLSVGPTAPEGRPYLSKFKAFAKIVPGFGYVVVAAVPFRHSYPKVGTVFGFDIQVNDARDGIRLGQTCFNQADNTGWQKSDVFGVGICYP